MRVGTPPPHFQFTGLHGSSRVVTMGSYAAHQYDGKDIAKEGCYMNTFDDRWERIHFSQALDSPLPKSSLVQSPAVKPFP